MEADVAAVLDAEYREFVRSLHGSTVATCTAIMLWHSNPSGQVLAALLGGQTPAAEDVHATESVLERWQDELLPQLCDLIDGHPDPDVRDAAQLLQCRIYALGFVLKPVLRGKESSPDLDLVRRVYDPSRKPLRRLRHAVREAPFRVHRPPSPSTQERYPEDRSFEEFPQSFWLWLDRLEQRERDFSPVGSGDA